MRAAWFTLMSVVRADSMSGGDRIGIEIVRRWARQRARVHLLTTPSGRALCEANGFDAERHTVPEFAPARLGVVAAYLLRVAYSIFRTPRVAPGDWIYSSSDFLPDVLPAWLMKRLEPNARWAAGLYLIAPNPWRGEAPFLPRPLLYWLGQQISLRLIGARADCLFVLNDQDRQALSARPDHLPPITVVGAAVDHELIARARQAPPPTNLPYDACFVGRLHAQKGLDDLLAVWQQVSASMPSAHLALIGWGEPHWERWLDAELDRLGLRATVHRLGFLDGVDKYRVMLRSKVLLFPSGRESWGLVVAEALACGLPVVAYELPVLRLVFGDHILTVPPQDRAAMAHQALGLLQDEARRTQIAGRGAAFASSLTWDAVAARAAAAISATVVRA